jgi:hypothetical protein
MSGNSYQKNGGVGVYHEVPNGASEGGGMGKKKIIGAIAIVIIAAVGYGYFDLHKPAGGASVAKAIQKADLPVSSSGKLKLFDKQSTFRCCSMVAVLKVIDFMCYSQCLFVALCWGYCLCFAAFCCFNDLKSDCF